MKSLKIISVFKTNEKIPFMTCIANDMEVNKDGIKLILESGESIWVKNYGYYFLSETEGDLERERMTDSYRRLFSELSGISKVTVNSLMS